MNPWRGTCGFKGTGDFSITWNKPARGRWMRNISGLKPGDTLALPMNNDAFPLNLEGLVLQGKFSGSRAALVFDLEHPDWRRFLFVILGTAALCRGPDATGNCGRVCLGAGGSGTAQELRRIFPAITAALL